ncbi:MULTISPECIES: isochorismate synthase MenF [unclassified Rhodococcus (in: high G+C Gram-positive bacteria)]|uniref:isochorismate synthase n=1 Tax=unclassified Rhodococcus (in: high G+C Gram-positive bacteria) TaxID=192944 RepID=UPI00163AA336|nr:MULTISPECIES: isochorismate synthase [unclassified Rhodococcus (in: high G+C Gram-positive bacteria)]MBC2639907.1 isochorismate synthase [Rhodococcus sp. 3A]MBC2895346.1 isochorismate synthase [Rhodococcus sp. 4CII]
MQSTAAAESTERSADLPPGAPFVLSRPHGTVIADGIRTGFDSARDAAAALRSGAVTSVAGALAFDRSHPAALIAPQALRRHPGSWTPRPRALPNVRTGASIPPEDEHVARVAAAISVLREPEAALHKVVLARSVVLYTDEPLHPHALLARLVDNDLGGNGFSVDLSAAGTGWSGRHLVGSSPEVLIRRHGDRVTCHPLAGSAPRHADPENDRLTADNLASSEKNLREHALVVDALRAGLEPFCTELDIPDRPTLTSTPQLWHLGTPVSGRLRDRSVTALDLAVAVHPTPAVCGTPTDVARALIGELEGDRGFYAGAVGWTDADGDGEWMVTIRCAQIDADGTTVTAYAGGGIVAASEPDDELAETTTKLGTVLTALGPSR